MRDVSQIKIYQLSRKMEQVFFVSILVLEALPTWPPLAFFDSKYYGKITIAPEVCNITIFQETQKRFIYPPQS